MKPSILFTISLSILFQINSYSQNVSSAWTIDFNIGHVIPNRAIQLNLRKTVNNYNLGAGINMMLNEPPRDMNNYVFKNRLYAMNFSQVFGVNLFFEKNIFSVKNNHWFLGYSLQGYRTGIYELSNIYIRDEFTDIPWGDDYKVHILEVTHGKVNTLGETLINTVYIRAEFAFSKSIFINFQSGLSIGSYYFEEYRNGKEPLRNNPFLFTNDWDVYLQFMVGMGYKFPSKKPFSK